MVKPISMSPLSSVTAITSVHRLHEVSSMAKINLRGDANNPAFAKAIKSALNLSLPTEANTCAHAQAESTVFWLGPDEWLVHTPLDALQKTLTTLRNATEPLHAAITDVSDYYLVLELSGPQARSILASGTSFDIRTASFKPGQCAQTLFGHASILLWPVDDTPTFCIQVRWSYAQYLFTYLSNSLHNAENLMNFKA